MSIINQQKGEKMLTIEQIKKLLEDRHLSIVAKNAGIGEATIFRLAKGKNVAYQTVKKLSDYLEGQLENAKQQ